MQVLSGMAGIGVAPDLSELSKINPYDRQVYACISELYIVRRVERLDLYATSLPFYSVHNTRNK